MTEGGRGGSARSGEREREDRARARELARRPGPLRWFARNPVVANALLAVLVVGGLVVSRTLTQEVFPDFELDAVLVDVQYPGASPEDVEQGVLLAIEEEVRGLDGVKEVTSIAAEGFGRVAIELIRGADGDQVLSRVKSAVGRITSFPDEIEEPDVFLATARRRVLSLVVHGDVEEETLRTLAERARRALLEDARITLVELGAARPREVAIEVRQETLRRHGLTLPEIAARVRQGSVDVPAGDLDAPQGQLLVRTDTRRRAEAFATIVLRAGPGGSVLRVGDVATVEDRFRDVDLAAFYGGEPALLVDVFRVGDQTPIEVSAAAREIAERLRPSLPPAVGIAVWQDRAELYDSRISLLLENGAWGLAFALVVLAVFLAPRLAFWVALGLPVSFVGALLVIGALDVSINMVSLFAFILVLGLVLDDAIVVGESIFEQRRRGGLDPVDAAVVGAREVAQPVIFAVLTTMVGFAPLLFVPGFAGKIFANIPLIVLPVLAISLAESLLILPAHLAHVKDPRRRGLAGTIDRWQERFSRGLDAFAERRFLPAVRWATRRRYVTLLAFGLVLAVALSMLATGLLRFRFMPGIEGDLASTTIELPVGVPPDATRDALRRVEDAARAALGRLAGDADVTEGMLSVVGSTALAGRGGGSPTEQGSHLAEVKVSFVPEGNRGFSAEQFVQAWREELGPLPGVERLSFGYQAAGADAPPIAFDLAHPDPETLRLAADALARRIAQYEGVFAVDDGFTPGQDQLAVALRPEGRALGLTAADVARQVRGAFHGAEALRQQRGRDEVRVMVRLAAEDRRTAESVDRLTLFTPDGRQVPLVAVADVRWDEAHARIERKGGARIAPVTADLDQRTTTANEVVARIVEQDLPEIQERWPELTWSFGGEQERQRETLGDLATLFGVALAVLAGLIVVALRSFTLPLVIASAIPFGLVGAVAGHLLLGYDLSIISLLGVVALAGVVVNDSLLLLLTVKRAREDGAGAREATRRASVRRFRPILLTTLTTFLGLSPLMLETSTQARFLLPMAISLGFGIVFATAITLLLVPALYLALDDAGRLVRRLRGKPFRERSISSTAPPR